ncbi:hypothetical protein [Escherichia coli]|uniref:hypothetical protein n=1 Tax=Escherichia coli TaxID=562 RepID=UPI000BE800AD|nr:hypothetical protein [Escherichia coli]
MSHNLEHQKVHTRMVKKVLKAVDRASNPPYQSVFADFIAGVASAYPFIDNCRWCGVRSHLEKPSFLRP